MADREAHLRAFGEILRRARKQSGLSQERLALYSELDRTFISLLERGKRQPTLSTLFALSETLNVRASTLIRRVEKQLEAS